MTVDQDGYVWVVNLGDENIHRINPATNAIDLTKRIIGANHYGYSDMTGIVSRSATTKIGSWNVLHNSFVPDTAWGSVWWTQSLPKGTFSKVRVRSSNDRRNWSLWEDVINFTSLRSTPPGRYLNVEATLQSVAEGAAPVLYDLTVGGGSVCGDLDHPYPVGDVNHDCDVNMLDLSLMAANWLESTAP